MSAATTAVDDIDHMPRGGPDASWLDRQLETDCRGYLDSVDVDDAARRQMVGALERLGDVFKEHERNAWLVLDEIADVGDPRILELGAGSVPMRSGIPFGLIGPPQCFRWGTFIILRR